MSSEQKVLTKTEWVRSEPVDRSKRVAYGGEVDSKHIQKGTRTRKNVNYNENKSTAMHPQRSIVRAKKDTTSRNALEVRNQSSIAQLTNRTKGLTLKAAEPTEDKPARKRVTTPKKNQRKVEEKPQEEEEEEEEQPEEEQEQEEEEDTTAEDYAKFKKGEDVEDDNEEYEDAEEAEEEDDLNNSAMDEDDAVEKLHEEAKEKDALPLVRDDKRRTEDVKLAPAVLKELKRLGATVPTSVKPTTYRNKITLPTPLAYLSATTLEHPTLTSKKHDIANVEIAVCDLPADDWNAIKFLKKNSANAVILAEGEVIIATRVKSGEDYTNPNVWICDEEGEEGPIKFSELLATFELGEPAEEEEEEGDDE